MTEQEKKKYILKVWKLSPGKKISEMLKRYWNLKNAAKIDGFSMAEKIFNS
jgi:hypothetical protein